MEDLEPDAGNSAAYVRGDNSRVMNLPSYLEALT